MDWITPRPGLNADDPENSVVHLLNWFYENFEDPAEAMPVGNEDLRRVGMSRGPYSPSFVFTRYFDSSAFEDLIHQAISRIARRGEVDWMPHTDRIQQEIRRWQKEQEEYERMLREKDQRDTEDEARGTLSSFEDIGAILRRAKVMEQITRPSSDKLQQRVAGAEQRLHELHSEMSRKISNLEDVLARIPATPVGLGHNSPPSAMDTDSLNDELRELIRYNTEILKSLGPKPLDKVVTAVHAVDRLKAARGAVTSYIAKQADAFATEASKAAGKAAGVAVVGSSLLMLLQQSLTSLLETARDWIVVLVGG